MGQPKQSILDVLIVGAGFSGLYTLHKLRELGFSARIYEMGNDIGGTWFWNRYPGARVDSEVPIYQLSIEKTWVDFNWTERYPGRDEIMQYFHHLDKTLDLKRDIEFNACVTSATFNETGSHWQVKTASGSTVYAQHLILCTGFAAKKYTPEIPGLSSFHGDVIHSAAWPEKDAVDFKNKRVAVIGTGASGVQIIQELGPVVKHLTVFQRTPNLSLPMWQITSSHPNFPPKSIYEETYKYRLKTFGGVNFDFNKTKFSDASPAERQVVFEEAWEKGGFYYWLSTYAELYFDPLANDEAYNFWCEKVRARINDPVKRDILAPIIPPHPFGTKRPSLEQNYFEVFNQDNVDLINVKEFPITEITPTGIRTEDGNTTEVDVIVFATGFDAVTGGILNIDIKNGEGASIQDKWRHGTSTFLGMTTSGFPNMYFMYGPQAPTAFSNGPTCSEIQGDWIVDLIVKMRQDGNTRVEAGKEAEDGWVATVKMIWDMGLFCKADSWYQGVNIPGKVKEALNYAGGIPSYIESLDNCSKDGYQGFKLD